MTPDPHAPKALIQQWMENDVLVMQQHEWDSLESVLTAALTPLAWSSTKPSEPGWYWWHKDDLVLAVELVKNIQGNLIEEHGDLSADDLVDAGWAGPLIPPLPPPREERR